MMKKNKIHLYLTTLGFMLFFLIHVIGCSQQSDSEMLFEKAKKTLGKEHSDAFKNLPSDLVMLYHVAASDTMKNYILEDSVFASNIIKVTDDHQISKYWAGYYFGFSFHNYLNHIQEGQSELLEKCFKADEKNKEYLEIEEKEQAEKYDWLTLSYFNKWNLGDTIQFIFPVLFVDNNYYNAVSYYDCRYVDSLSLLGVLTDKQFKVQAHSNGTSYPITFNIKAIKVNNPKYDNFEGKKFKLNDTLEVNIRDYVKYYEIYRSK